MKRGLGEREEVEGHEFYVGIVESVTVVVVHERTFFFSILFFFFQPFRCWRNTGLVQPTFACFRAQQTAYTLKQHNA
jgi:hypothetical protein